METSAASKSVRISNKFLAEGAQQANSGSILTCKQCDKRVYEMEKIVADSSVYHKSCFKCSHCKRVLSLGNYTAAGGNKQLYCKPHFIELFRTKGNYEEGFGMEKKTRPPGCDTFEGLQPNAGSAAKPKSPSKWERSGGQPEIVNRRDDMDGSNDDRPPPSTTRDMLAKYTNAAAGEGQGARSHEPMSITELPEQGTTKALLAKFKEIQTGGGTNGKSPAPKQPIKLIDDEVHDDRRSAAPVSPHSPERVTPEGSVAGPASPQQDEQMSSLGSPTKYTGVSSPRANGNGMMDIHSERYISQYDTNDDDEREEIHSNSVGHSDDASGAVLLMKKLEVHDISDEDEVEKDIESRHHHHHDHHEGHHDHDEDQGHRDLEQDHQQSSYGEAHHHEQDDDIEHHFDNEQSGLHHAADEGQLIDFGEGGHDDGRYAEGDESPRQRESVSHESLNPQARYSHTEYEERANASGDDDDDYEAAKINQAKRYVGDEEEE